MSESMSGTVLVTGAGKRLGRAIALQLAAEGFDLALHFNTSRVEVEKVQALIEAGGRRAVTVYGDLGDPAFGADALMKGTLREIKDQGPLVGLVNSASAFEADRFETMNAQFYRQQMAVNADAPLFLTQELYRAAPGSAWVVNLIDTKINVLTPDFFSYTLSKLALENITRLTAQACAPKLRVNAVAPGLVLRSGNQTTETFEREHNRIPLRVGPTPQDIAETVLFLARASTVSGQIIAVDGGRHFYTPSSMVQEFEVPGEVDPGDARMGGLRDTLSAPSILQENEFVAKQAEELKGAGYDHPHPTEQVAERPTRPMRDDDGLASRLAALKRRQQ